MMVLFTGFKSFNLFLLFQYKQREAIAMAGKIRPTRGTKIVGKYEADINKIPSKI
jgi:hypothetical protein